MVSVPIHPSDLSFENFMTTCGDDTNYELIDGELINLEPTGLHEQVTRC